MSLVLVDQPEGGKVTVNGPKATVTLEGETPREVSDTAAKNAALNAARPFISKPGISSQSGHYPVDAEGKQVTTGNSSPVSRYRQDFTIQEGM